MASITDFLNLVRPLTAGAIAKRAAFSPLMLPAQAAMFVGSHVPADDAVSMGLRKAYADKRRQAILGQTAAQPAPGQELGANLPSTGAALKTAVNWLQQHADPNPQAYAGSPGTPQAPATNPINSDFAAMGQGPKAPAGLNTNPTPTAPTPGAYDPTGGIIPAASGSSNGNGGGSLSLNDVTKLFSSPSSGSGGIGSDFATSAAQNAAATPFSPFSGSGFGAGDGFMSPANMGEGSSLPSFASIFNLFR
jgi:hypothetical protein